MATRKSTASKTDSTPSLTTQAKSRGRRTGRSVKRAVSEASGSRRSNNRGFDFAKYLTPGAAILASGALAAAGYIFKDEIADFSTDALKVATKNGTKAALFTSKAVDAARDQALDTALSISDKVSLASLLRIAGLQKKSTFFSILGPTLGVAGGFIAGSALTYFFGPKLLEQLNDKGIGGKLESESLHDDSEIEQDGDATSGASEASSASSSESARVNGGLYRGVS